ncbi:peptidylprolyl isomerase [Mucilaginibacter limnophilus]|uniref:peptidylprolyl isomerase n=1 Tax=Mucilaginibacter limnophilus TaxID=1932778 RepID=A0A437ML25_9SPHI|nr:FKBP-type peptidyl-prolyl cis-trans isomerase [Mucilaginibacter limnophilus]RVT98361.1 peptidylprolyl isomerase [Mucilaginibacter limnophilus]
MKKYILAAALLATVFASKAQQQINGTSFALITDAPGDKAKIDDIISFNIIQRTEKDSVLFSSYQMGRPIQLRIKPSQNVMDLMDVFVQMSAGDSAMVKIPTDSIFKGRESERPPFITKGSQIVTLIKMEKVQSMATFMAERNAELEKLKAAEAAEAGEYIITNKLKPVTTASGLKYIITAPSAKAKPKAGDTVLVNYVGRTLDDKVFDSSIESEAQKAGLSQPGREYKPIEVILGQNGVIKGWEEGLLLLGEGAKAKLIIPSQLGYGDRGAGQAIKPYSTLVFDVELVKIKRAKAAAPGPVMKRPLKKRPSVSKPAAKKTPVSKKKN